MYILTALVFEFKSSPILKSDKGTVLIVSKTQYHNVCLRFHSVSSGLKTFFFIDIFFSDLTLKALVLFGLHWYHLVRSCSQIVLYGTQKSNTCGRLFFMFSSAMAHVKLKVPLQKYCSLLCSYQCVIYYNELSGISFC